jgi:hypothetical protein
MAYNSVEEWRSAKDSKREKFMTKDEMVMVNEYISKLNNRVGDMGRLFANWDEIEEYYSNEQADIEGSPNTKVNIINSNVEGIAVGRAEHCCYHARRGSK